MSDEGPSQKQWQAKHRIVWEAAHRPIPEGHRLLLLDGNPADYHLDNLKLVTYKVGAVMNKQGLHIKGDKEMNEAGSLIAELIIKNNTFKKGHINDNKKHAYVPYISAIMSVSKIKITYRLY